MAPARTGRDNNSKIAVIRTDQTNRDTRSIVIPGIRILITVVIKFTAPRIEDTPAKCNEKMDRSTDIPAWAIALERGG